MFQWKDREFLRALEGPEELEKRISSAMRVRLGASLFALFWAALFFFQLFTWLSIKVKPVQTTVELPPGLPLSIFATLGLMGLAAVAHAELRSLFVVRRIREERGAP